MIRRLALFLLLAILACQPSPARQRQASDTGSVSIDTVPELDIGAEDAAGSVVFMDVIDATRLSSGVIVVADRASHSLRFLTPQGALLREVGRKGAGPGEYDWLTSLEQCAPDSLFVLDQRQRRITVVDSAGKFIRQFGAPGESEAIRCTNPDTFIELGYPKEGGMFSADSPPTTAELTSYSSDGHPLHNFGLVPFGILRPLAARTTIAVSGGRVFVGPGDSAFVRVMTLSGTSLPAIVLGTTGRAVEPRHYTAEIEHILLFFRIPEDRERPREILLKIPAPKFLPAYREIFTDPTGAIWAVTSPLGEGVTVLEGADSLGRPLGELRIPLELDVHEIGRDYLLGIAENASGDQRVLLYRIRR